MIKPQWHGVYPAMTTQFHVDLSVDLDATQRTADQLIKDGVHGLVCLGTVGENTSHTAAEKRQVLRAVVEAAGGRVPVLTGVAELTTAAAMDYARDAEQAGADGLMVLPAMVYHAAPHEVVRHFTAVASATGLPIMAYNNPPAYGVDLTPDILSALKPVANIVALKEAIPDARRITDLINALGDRLILFSGIDDLAFEGLTLGAQGWVSGLTNAFPAESVAMVDLIQAGRFAEARSLYRWFMPLLHLDALHSLVQCIKLTEAMVGRGTERVRPPRYVLEGAERQQVIAIVEAALANRPDLAALAKAA